MGLPQWPLSAHATWSLVSPWQIFRKEGVLGYYKGNGANVARVIPVYGLKFAFNDYFKNLIAPGVQRPTTTQLIMVRLWWRA
jgi:hypothetical protein